MSQHPVVDSSTNDKPPRLITLPDNQIAVVGHTSPIVEKLKEAGGEYNRTAQPVRGWIFSADKMETVNKILSEASHSHTGAPAGESSHAPSSSSEAVVAHSPMDVIKTDDKTSQGHDTSQSSHPVEGEKGHAHTSGPSEGQPSSPKVDIAHATRSHSHTAGEEQPNEAGQTTTATETMPSTTLSEPKAGHAEAAPTTTTTGTVTDTTDNPPVSATSSAAATGEPSVVEKAQVVEPAEVTASKAPYIVHLTTRSIAVLGDCNAWTNELTKLGGKFNKAMQVGDHKLPGWQFPKKQLSEVQNAIPGVSIAPTPVSTTSPKAEQARSGEKAASGASSGGAQGSSGEASPTSPHKRQRLGKPAESQHSVAEA